MATATKIKTIEQAQSVITKLHATGKHADTVTAQKIFEAIGCVETRNDWIARERNLDAAGDVVLRDQSRRQRGEWEASLSELARTLCGI